MAAPVLSQKLTAETRRRLRTGPSDEQARDALQARLNAYSKVMFWSFVALLTFLTLGYRFLLHQPPTRWPHVFGGSAVLLAVMAVLWRAVLYRRRLSVVALYRIDLVYAITIGTAFGMSAMLQWDLQAAGHTSLLFGGYTVFTRALLVPSSARRTVVASLGTFLPIMMGGVYLGITTEQELPGPAFIGGAATMCAIAIVIAANGSAIIYGLRRQVSEAQQLGQYTLEHRIGGGGMGTVYRAHHALLRRPTAIKLLLPDKVGTENLERFEREVQATSRLTHPNTVAVYDYGYSDGRFYYAMEYLDGIDLERLVTTYGPQPAGRVAHIIVQVCGALQEAHDAGMIHRDIKPANIILCERGGMSDVAKVVDFGLVKEIARESGATSQMILGTPAYIAPEAVTEPDHVGPAADIYALGCVAYYLLTGRRVFEARTQIDMCIQHVKAPPPPIDDRHPPELATAIMRCLAKRPEDRYDSARALAAAIQPLSRSWDLEPARTWWQEFRLRRHEPAAADTATLTITVDLGHRVVGDDLEREQRVSSVAQPMEPPIS